MLNIDQANVKKGNVGCNKGAVKLLALGHPALALAGKGPLCLQQVHH